MWRVGGRGSHVETRPLLPNWHELLAAFCGHIGDQPEDHMVTRWARLLAELHLARRQQPDRIAEIDHRRAHIVTCIDDFVVIRSRRGATSSGESLGSVVDAMAAAHVRAVHLLRTVEDVSDDRVHAAWFRLASMADGWTDRVAGVIEQPVRRTA
ncbi:DUF4254 domain-containing protein [Nocardia uniformis]|uniref:DUF4254 domain-containing protein n=1 Tax=Nocardia uniformis TaxID=53432 RepID=A0A849CD24_9NOCA|nr:DUF4254 domain-containing protein [Nocardia uniformis]